MATRHQYFEALHALLRAMPPGKIDMDQIEMLEQRHSHWFTDPPEIVERWLLDEQRRVQAM
jgi:hypothetical protein